MIQIKIMVIILYW